MQRKAKMLKTSIFIQLFLENFEKKKNIVTKKEKWRAQTNFDEIILSR